MGAKKTWELVLEIGHRSTPLNKKLPNGYTHKWTAFVKGASNSKIEHCVSHVVFQLHESFEKPYRDIHEPPYQIKETGYAGFEIPIQIFFKNKDKPNHLAFVHDLTLLNNKPNNHSSIEKIKFINPNKEFERHLIKAGAQLLPAPSKKDRCESPPAKKQKSSSLIPSKDMSKVGQSQSQTQSQHHHSSHHKSSSSSSHTNHSSNHHRHDHSNHHNSNHHHHKDNNYHGSTTSSKNHLSSKQQQIPAPQSKTKPSNSFVDIFGKPLVYNQSQDNTPSSVRQSSSHPSSSNPPSNSSTTSSSNPPSSSNTSSTLNSITAPTSTPNSISTSTSTTNLLSSQPASNHVATNSTSNQPLFAVLQNRIACLNNYDLLQKIVDIVEESGEFNITSTKFEFDLKRLDKRTLSTIESLIN